MSFNFGNFYGLTGVMALYADPAQFSKMLQVPSISADARESLINLYQELYAIKMVFDPTNTDESIPHASVAVDKSSEEAIKYLRGYNNYIAYTEQQMAMFETPTEDIDLGEPTDLDLDGMDFDAVDITESVNKTSMFVDDLVDITSDIDVMSSDALMSTEGDSALGLEDMDLDDIAPEDSLNLADPTDEVTLFSTYNQVFNPETGEIDLIKWGELYPESYDSEEQQAKQLAWGAAIKRMKKETDDPNNAKFIAQRKKLPTVVANCSLSQQLKSSIRSALNSNVDYATSAFEEEFAMKLLDSIHRKATEPARISLDGENSPKLDLLLSLLESAINAPSNAYIKRFGVSMSELALWNTRTPYVINSMVIKFVDSLLDVSNLNKRKAEDAINTIQHLLTDCDYLLGVNNSDIKEGSSNSEIAELFSACELSPASADAVCEAFLQEKFSLTKTENAEIAAMLARFIRYGINTGADSEQRLHTLETLLVSQENLVFAHHAYITAESATQQLSSELLRIYYACAGAEEDPLGLRALDFTGDSVYPQMQHAMLSLFKGFVLRTGICGCSLCYFDKMYAMTCQIRPAIISTAPVKFTTPGYERAYNAILLFKGYLRSTLNRINRMCKGA